MPNEIKNNNIVDIDNQKPILELPKASSLNSAPEEGNIDRIKRAIEYTLADQERLYAEQNSAYEELETATNQLSNVQKQLDGLQERINELHSKLSKKSGQLKILSLDQTKMSERIELAEAIIMVHERDV